MSCVPSAGAAAVFTDLERGAVAIVKSTGSEASKTVGHKYGEDAGKVTDDSLAAAAHGVNLAYVSTQPRSPLYSPASSFSKFFSVQY